MNISRTSWFLKHRSTCSSPMTTSSRMFYWIQSPCKLQIILLLPTGKYRMLATMHGGDWWWFLSVSSLKSTWCFASWSHQPRVVLWRAATTSLKILPDILFMNNAQFVCDINNTWYFHPYFSKIHLKYSFLKDFFFDKKYVKNWEMSCSNNFYLRTS